MRLDYWFFSDAIYIPLLLVLFGLHPDPWKIIGSKDALHMPALHLAIFAAAVAMTCVVRKQFTRPS